MISSAIICLVTWLISFLSWMLVSTPDLSHLEESYEVTWWLLGYFSFNALIDLSAYWLIGFQRIRWATKPLRYVLLASVMLHVAGGVGYALDYDYSRFYVVGLWIIAGAQILCFIGPRARQHLCRYERERRAVARSAGVSHSTHDRVAGC